MHVLTRRKFLRHAMTAAPALILPDALRLDGVKKPDVLEAVEHLEVKNVRVNGELK